MPLTSRRILDDCLDSKLLFRILKSLLGILAIVLLYLACTVKICLDSGTLFLPCRSPGREWRHLMEDYSTSTAIASDSIQDFVPDVHPKLTGRLQWAWCPRLAGVLVQYQTSRLFRNS